jgi:hypothetical protein
MIMKRIRIHVWIRIQIRKNPNMDTEPGPSADLCPDTFPDADSEKDLEKDHEMGTDPCLDPDPFPDMFPDADPPRSGHGYRY